MTYLQHIVSKNIPNISLAQFETQGGTLRFNKSCVYDFYSSRNSKQGRFFSPFYPQTYPSPITCYYVFHAAQNERIIMNFLFVTLTKDFSHCVGDIITVKNGTDSEDGLTLAILCGRKNERKNLVSLSSEMTVVFTSNCKRSTNFSCGGDGFKAEYQFINKNVLPKNHSVHSVQGMHFINHKL